MCSCAPEGCRRDEEVKVDDLDKGIASRHLDRNSLRGN